MHLLRAENLVVHFLLLLLVQCQELRRFCVELIFRFRIEQFILALNVVQLLLQLLNFLLGVLYLLLLLLADLLVLHF